MSKLVASAQSTGAMITAMQAELHLPDVKEESAVAEAVAATSPGPALTVNSQADWIGQAETTVASKADGSSTDVVMSVDDAVIDDAVVTEVALSASAGVRESAVEVEDHPDQMDLQSAAPESESTPSVAVSSSAVTTGPAPPPSLANLAALKQQLSTCETALKETSERLKRSKLEESSCSNKARLEESKMEEAIEWMLAIQGVLWPENLQDRELGRPILPANLRKDGTKSGMRDGGAIGDTPSALDGSVGDIHERSEREEVEESNRQISCSDDDSKPPMFLFFSPLPDPAPKLAANACSRSKNLLSYGMRNALDAARILNIVEIVDVDNTIEAFRWMAWCYRCLHVLRIPPATHTLRRLILCCKHFKMADDKLIRALGGILTRSLAFKSKARRLVFGGQAAPSPLPSSITKKLDSGKLHTLIAEGGMVPVTSALKDHLVLTWDRMLKNASSGTAPTPTILPAVEQAVPATTGVGGKPKRVAKASTSPVVPGIATFAMATMSDKTFNSSDEEDCYVEIEGGDASLSAGTRREHYEGDRKRDFVYTTLSPSMWASMPQLWPPALTVRQVLTTTNHYAPLNARNGGNDSNVNSNNNSNDMSSRQISSSSNIDKSSNIDDNNSSNGNSSHIGNNNNSNSSSSSHIDNESSSHIDDSNSIRNDNSDSQADSSHNEMNSIIANTDAVSSDEIKAIVEEKVSTPTISPLEASTSTTISESNSAPLPENALESILPPEPSPTPYPTTTTTLISTTTPALSESSTTET